MTPLTNFPNGISVNGVEILPGWQIASKAVTYDGGTTNAQGDYDGTGNPTTLFTVTGDVMVIVFGKCTTLLAGASATVEVGVASNTAGIIAQSTATDIDAGEVWRDATPAVGVESLNDPMVIIGGADIIETIATANVTSGAITYYCLWIPLSSDGAVAAA
ncbi:MAG: hypothetical protein K8L99_18210 [Anaerolineae bacterium]|nr:hypothetical protein [Anaerolineae bacterium]